jgi:urease accessory protein UreF
VQDRQLGLDKSLVPSQAHARVIGKADMVLNDSAEIEVDPETYEVRADGELLTCEPADVLADGAALFPVLNIALLDVVTFARAFQPSAELKLETLSQGEAFCAAVVQGWPCKAMDVLRQVAPDNVPYPVAVGVACAGHGIGRSQALHSWLHASVSNLVSAAIRLVPLGQNQGQRLLAGIEPAIRTARDQAADLPLSRLTTNCLMADICSMQHETQHTRLFRS